ncbi:MAG: metal ABC transporter substrate-binding protein [Candidatus Omnitrophota bacterium]
MKKNNLLYGKFKFPLDSPLIKGGKKGYLVPPIWRTNLLYRNLNIFRAGKPAPEFTPYIDTGHRDDQGRPNLLVRMLLILVLSGGLSGFLYPEENTNNKISRLATTTLIGGILDNIAKTKGEVIVLVPGGNCPGHFDATPETVLKIAKAKFIFRHSWEKWIERIKSVNENKNLKEIDVMTEGNWMIPEIQMTAAEEITGAMNGFDGKNSGYYLENLKEYNNEISEQLPKYEEIKKRFRGLKAISSIQQEEFLRWLGLDVVAVYGRPEELTLKKMKELLVLGKKKKVKVIVDNLQSGPETGKNMAETLGILHVTLTNFPVDKSYIDTLEQNISRLEKAMK